jgi:hypothetical protein
MGTLYTFPHNDEAGDQINIGFDFPFLGGTYSQCIINANGWVGFGSDNTAWDNTSIPSSAAPGPAIFGLWDDLNPVNDQCNADCSGYVYYYGDEQKFIVGFDQVVHWIGSGGTEGTYDFQFVIYPDGNIDLNYNTLTGTHTATVGIQDAGGNNGMQVTSNIQSELSLRFSQGPDWVSVTPSTGEVNAGSSEVLTVEANASDQEEGLYEGYLRLVTSGGNAGLPVSMIVSGSASMQGDINGDESVNIQDIIFLINFILDVDEPDTGQFSAADMNGDGVLNIQDIILIINVILS